MSSKQATVSTYNSTNFYKFNFNIPDGFNISKNDSEIYLVLDVSGSMGSVIPQVKTALKEFLKKLPADSNIKLYTFESNPHFIYGGKINSTLFSKINEIRSMGGTNFTAINLKLAEDISKSGFKNINVVYFTDGCDGSSFYRTNSPTSINYGIDNMKAAYAGKNSRIFSIGFTSSHDAKFIGKLTSSGTHNGLFQYLKDISGLSECIDPILGLLSQNVFNLEINGNSIQSYDFDPDLKTVTGSFTHTNDYKDLNFHLVSGREIFDLNIKADVTEIELNDKIKISTQTIYDTIRNGVAQLEKDKSVLKDMNATIKQSQQDLQVLQSEIRTRSRLERKIAMKELESIYPLIDNYFRLSSQVAAGNCSNDVFAQLNSIGYSGQLKAGLQRKLDARSEANADKQQNADQKKIQLLKDVPEITTAPEFEEMKCFLTFQNAAEAYSDADSMCFTFDCGRSPAAVADPTKVDIKKILPSFITSEGFLDAAKMAGAGSLGDFDKNSQACVITSEGREPISGALPLYINADNWKMAKLNLAPILGLITTCDPLGYSYSQINALYFKALHRAKIQMVTEPSEWITNIYGLIHITCEHVLRDYKEIEKVIEAFNNFKEPINRTIDVIPCLHTFSAQIMVLINMNEIHADDPFLNGDFMRFMVEEQHRRSLPNQIDDKDIIRMVKKIFKFNAEDYYLNDLLNDQSKFDHIMSSKSGNTEEQKYEKYFCEKVGIKFDVSSKSGTKDELKLLSTSPNPDSFEILPDTYEMKPIKVHDFSQIIGIPQPTLTILEQAAMLIQNMFQSKNASRRSAIDDGSFTPIINSESAHTYLTQVCRKIISDERKYEFDQQHAQQNAATSSSGATLFCMTDNLKAAAGFLYDCRTFCPDDKPTIGKDIYTMLGSQDCPHALEKMKMLKSGVYHYKDGVNDVQFTVQYDKDGTRRTWSPRKQISNRFYMKYRDQLSTEDWKQYFKDSNFGGIIGNEYRYPVD
jgi:hypothetical protein